MFLISLPFLFPHLKSLTSDGLTSEDCVVCGANDDNIPLGRGAAVCWATAWAGTAVTVAEGAGGAWSGPMAHGGAPDSECGVAVSAGGAGSNSGADGGAPDSECGVAVGTGGAGGGVTDGSL